MLSDLETIAKAILKQQKVAKAGDKTAKSQLELLNQLQSHLDKGLVARTFDILDEDKPFINSLQLLTHKPTMYIANVNDQNFSNNPYLKMVQEIAAAEGSTVVVVCASLEAEVADLSDEEKLEFLAEMDLHEPGLNRVIRSGYQLLNLETYFTAGVKEVRAWTIHKNSTAPQAAGKIHTDFEKGFIRAEVISFADFITYQGEQGAKEAGKWRLEGKEYIVQDGDVIHFRFNV